MWPVSVATCCIDGYFQMHTWFCTCPAEKPCVETSSFEFFDHMRLQIWQQRQRCVVDGRGRRLPVSLCRSR